MTPASRLSEVSGADDKSYIKLLRKLKLE